MKKSAKKGADLASSLTELRYEVEAIVTMVTPNDRHTVIEHQTRTACRIMLASLEHHIRDAEELAHALNRNR